ECRDPVEAPAHPFLKYLDLRQGCTRDSGEPHIAMRQVNLRGIEMVGQEGTGLASFFPVGSEHEVIDDQLAVASKQISKCFRAVLAFENVVFFDAFPRQFAPLPAQFIPSTSEFLFS